MSDAKKRRGCRGPMLAALAAFVGFSAWIASQRREAGSGRTAAGPPPGSTAPAWSASVGEAGQLGYRGGGGNAVWLAVEESAWDAMLDAQNRGARGGPGAGSALYRLSAAGKIKAYPVGTRVRVIRSEMVSRKVEVLGGEDAGETGWVQAELVQPPR